MLFYVLANNTDRCSTATCRKITRRPEDPFPVSFQKFRVFPFQKSAGNSFQAIYMADTAFSSPLASDAPSAPTLPGSSLFANDPVFSGQIPESCLASPSLSLSPFFSNACEPFGACQKLNSLVFNRFRTLCAKHPGGGYPILPKLSAHATQRGRRLVPGGWGSTGHAEG